MILIEYVNEYKGKFKQLEDRDIKNNSLHRWLSFFDKDTPEEVLKEVFSMEEAIEKAHKKIEYLRCDEDALRLYEMREMAMCDYTSGINAARKSAAIEIAQNALKERLTVEFVKKITGLDESTINQLQKELNSVL